MVYFNRYITRCWQNQKRVKRTRTMAWHTIRLHTLRDEWHDQELIYSSRVCVCIMLLVFTLKVFVHYIVSYYDFRHIQKITSWYLTYFLEPTNRYEEERPNVEKLCEITASLFCLSMYRQYLLSVKKFKSS